MRWPGWTFLKILGGSDNTAIGNTGDKLHVLDQDVVTAIGGLGGGGGTNIANIFKRNEAAVTSRNPFDLANTTYTVPTGKEFTITAFNASYDAQAALFVRVKKQTSGTGPWETLFRMNMMSGGQGNSTIALDLGSGIKVGLASDVFKIEIESSIAKGTIWAEYAGVEA